MHATDAVTKNETKNSGQLLVQGKSLLAGLTEMLTLAGYSENRKATTHSQGACFEACFDFSVHCKLKLDVCIEDSCATELTLQTAFHTVQLWYST